MRWDRNYKQPDIINDPVIIPAYGVTDVERAYWNAKQEALEYDRYPTLRSDKHCTSGVIHRALEDYKVAAVELSQAFFWGHAQGLAVTKEACEASAEAAAQSATQSAASALSASQFKDSAAFSANAASGYANTALIHANSASDSKDAAANSASAAAQAVLDAQDNEYDAEAWAVGERNGVPVPATDPAYHNNSKYYADLGSEVIQDDEISLYTTWSSTKLSTEFLKYPELVSGKVPAAYLPSYVDDVIEGYYNTLDGKFYEESTYETEITPEAGKLYSDLGNDKTYRWGGSAYAQMDAGLVIGELAGTAYEGIKGKANADAIAVIQGLIPNAASVQNQLATASDIPTVPTALSAFTDDSTHRLVTDTEKATWNGKATFTDIATGIAAAFNGVTFTVDSDDIVYINW